MRAIFAAMVLSASTAMAFGEEAYTITGKAYGACVGTQMRLKCNPPERIDEVIKEKCGRLEEQEEEQFEEEQFNDFLRGHIGETFTAELAFTIMAHDIASLTETPSGWLWRPMSRR